MYHNDTWAGIWTGQTKPVNYGDSDIIPFNDMFVCMYVDLNNECILCIKSLLKIIYVFIWFNNDQYSVELLYRPIHQNIFTFKSHNY